ncbi:hypothetical protein ACFHW2_11720 [Actinomadura sp. LOL_016]|uniref:hypothetical protein n=1 Tax=unclassified Actinomadura TaxID=2626254 RepID=UPI003A7F74A8
MPSARSAAAELVEAGRRALDELDDLVGAFPDAPGGAEPTAPDLAGLAAESASVGVPVDLVEEGDPATPSPAVARDLPGSARGHLNVLGRAVPVPEPAGFGNGSGGVISTADDMGRWLIAQHTGSAAPHSTKELRTPSRQNEHDALGWMLDVTERGTTSCGSSPAGDLRWHRSSAAR